MWLIPAKIHPPSPNERLIARQRLRRYVSGLLRSRLALVHGPAGFGKTCLLAEWQRCLRTRHVRSAWLSLDEQDSEPLQFLAYFTVALSSTGIDFGHLTAAAERGFADVPVSSIITALKRGLQRVRGRTVVMLDDYHRLQGPAIDETVKAVLDTLGAQLTLVISARELPDWIGSRSALRETCIEVGSDQLRFTVDETRALLRHSAPVSEEDLEAITVDTDGWPIALAAVRERLASGWTTVRVREAFTQAPADLGRYVTDQILRSLSADEREFVARTALPDRFTGTLARALCDDMSVPELIAALERKDLLVASWDGERRWFRYHRLLAELAVSELDRARPQLAQSLHRRASEWFFEQGYHAEAVRHALATRDVRLLAELFERGGGWRLVISGYVGLARNALTLIPPEVLREYPRAHLARILMLLKLGRVDEARQELRSLRSTHLPGADPLLEVETAVLDACTDRYGDVPVNEDDCRALAALRSRIPPDHFVLRSTFDNVLCTVQLELGRLEEALQTAERAVMCYRRMGSLFGEIFVHVHQGHALIEYGRLRDAEIVLRQACRLARDSNGPDTETEAIAAAMLSLALYERGSLEEAHGLLTRALPAIEHGESWFDLLAAAYQAAAGLAGTRSRESVIEVAARARHTAERRRMPRLQWLADVIELRARLHMEKPSASRLQILARSLEAAPAAQTGPRLHLQIQVALAWLALHERRSGAARELAAEIAGQASSMRHARLAMEARLIEALGAMCSGDEQAAYEAFEAAVSLAVYEGYQQVFCEAGAQILPLIDLVTGAGGAPAAYAASTLRARDRFLRDIAERLARERESDTTPELSPRERAVLRLLADGLSNKAIARALGVSDNTIKFHLKNLFAKLGVSTRREAVRRAAALRAG